MRGALTGNDAAVSIDPVCVFFCTERFRESLGPCKAVELGDRDVGDIDCPYHITIPCISAFVANERNLQHRHIFPNQPKFTVNEHFFLSLTHLRLA
jgi:hypothetical protein